MTVSSSVGLAGETVATLIAATPLDAGSFAEFGEVLALSALQPASVNEGRGLRRNVPRLAAQPGLRDSVALYDLAPSLPPVPVGLVERHPLAAQLFMPLEVGRWLVVVMPQRPDGTPDAAGVRAFVAGPDQAVVYAPGVWHLPLVALDRPARFLMRMAEGGTADDCHERRLAPALHVTA